MPGPAYSLEALPKCRVCSLILHCDQLFLRKISKTGAVMPLDIRFYGYNSPNIRKESYKGGGEKRWGAIWPTEKFWRGALYGLGP